MEIRRHHKRTTGILGDVATLLRGNTIALFVLILLLGSLISCSEPAMEETKSIQPVSPGVPQALNADFSVNGKVLFVKDGLIHLWSRGTARKLTSEGRVYHGPSWSPDAQRIAAVWVGDNHSDLVILNSEGKLEKQLTRNISNSSVQQSIWARRPSWSPDGAMLAYTTDRGSFRFGLWLIDIGSSTPRHANYRALGEGDVDSPSWSKDGKKVAFVAYWGEASQLYVLDHATGAVKKLTDHKEGVYDAAWSPDGSRIAYVKRLDGKHDVWVVDANGGGDARVTNVGMARSPAWSPDGQMIAFAANAGDGFDLYAVAISLTTGGGLAATEAKQLTRGLQIDATAGISWAK